MKAGLLRNFVQLQSRLETVDDIGQPSTSWITTSSVYADIRYLSGMSALKAGADVAIGRVSIRMRHRAINAGQRIVYGNEVFEIDQILPDGKRAFLDCVCRVLNADV